MKLVLIDRDGVINEEKPGEYIKSPAELIIYPAALEAFQLLRKEGFTCVVITNQSVVGRGIISLTELEKINQFLFETINKNGGRIEDILFCTDAPANASYRRKPKPGMLIEAMDKFKASARSTPFIGDSLSDLQAAQAAGCARYLVTTGKGQETALAIPENLKPVTLCTDILDAARKVVDAHR
jgi:D-glycero-D-manno-heptose 1,7-bisphosphate phosphatase